MHPHIAIIGGGVTGITTAYTLARRGCRVTVFERHRYAAMETSFANGGQPSASNAEVWTHRSTLVKGLNWMLKSDAPLLVNPRSGWHKIAWFAEFIASMLHYRRNTIETARLAVAARRHLLGWAAAEGIDFDLEQRGILHIYRDKKGFDHAGKVSKMLALGGLERRAVTPAEMRAMEPALAGTYYGGYFTQSDATGDIHKFTHGMAAAAERLGVRCLYGQDVAGLHSDGKTAMVTVAHAAQQSVHRFDGLVVCAGVASRRFAAQLGDRVNIYPVKGYSITVNLLDAQSQAGARPR
jgi:D-amino-acid dehydrogenase